MCQQRLLRLLERLVFVREITPDYTYYQIAMPWLQIKVLRTLQYFGAPEGPQATKELQGVIQQIFSGGCHPCHTCVRKIQIGYGL
jgi:AP-2 complex subunit alpha